MSEPNVVLLARIPQFPVERKISTYLGRMLKEGLSQIGIQATSTKKDQYYRIQFDSFTSFLDFFKEKFWQLPVELSESNHEGSSENHEPVFQIQFAVEELPEEFADIDVLQLIMNLIEKVGFSSQYQKQAGICTINLPIEACFVLFLELVQNLLADEDL